MRFPTISVLPFFLTLTFAKAAVTGDFEAATIFKGCDCTMYK
ncbi:hypothetical protein SNOG_07242 [Parastagonospora nodorum SN15]|uniref:Uncharacterized protein n=1 Tax=Phaeosphaeria nodorum (strain SN15 / ATCC MYA-4574 / FGSC 10173) TaxID=321614 RepID=Q0ULX2_PHANO|nr:hypothetical protein SNOG_07242 [Parastagonospora nodorum SN15]EAT85893.1 hypothetical protein SNOG_07242 [Parastagonospora nodorum SN15]